ncbi:hypothetical protein, partial [Leuconostoc pseudomesenteroides]|uniref:hypothetical protein n=1 Tax=Leuconostoc pseudomesenteroides TaxID=33968 RepID=UPI002896FF60
GHYKSIKKYLQVINRKQELNMSELTEYQRGLIDGFVSGLKPQLSITKKPRHTYRIKHDFEVLLKANDVPEYISQEQAETILQTHGFMVVDHLTNINNNMAMIDTRTRLENSRNGVIVKLDSDGNYDEYINGKN